MSKKKLSYDDFRKYFGNNLQDKDKHAFEKKIMQDAFEEEAFDGLSELSEQELDKDIAELKDGIKKRTKQSRRIVPVWFKYAASVIVLIGVGFTLFFFNSRLWQDSLLKEQMAREMEIADSVTFEAERAISYTKQDTFAKHKATELIADSKQRTEDKKQVRKETSETIDIIENQIEQDLDDELVISDFEEEELPEESLPRIEEVSASQPTAAIEGLEAEKELAFVSVESATEKESESKIARAANRTKKSARPSAGTEKVTTTLAYENKDHSGVVIRGKIVSADDDLSIPGVSVMIKDNPSIGTTTDMDGEFEVSIPHDEGLKTLIASFVGMETQEIKIENDSNILVYMEPEALEMDEVVVTGYGIDQNREETTRTNAQPPGNLSLSEFKKQILENLDYSKLSEYQGSYSVEVSFDVDINGRLHNYSFKNIPGVSFGNEIKRVIQKLERWEPATKSGSKISSRVRMNLRIEVTK